MAEMASTSRLDSLLRTKLEPRMPIQEDDTKVVTEIFADLAENCANEFSGPPANYHETADAGSTLRLEDNRVLTRSGSSASILPLSTTEVVDLERQARPRTRKTQAEEKDHTLGVMGSYRTSRQKSISRASTIRDGIADSATSLVKKDKKAVMKTYLGKGKSAEKSSASEKQAEDTAKPPTYPSPAKTAVIMVSLYISIFLVAIDRTIIGPAIPAITNQFNSIGDIGWYGSSYMLTSAGFILLYGRIYTFFPTKSVFLSGIFLFEIGSAVCGAAQSSTMLIIGRAIAGLGSSGIFTGASLIMLNTVPLRRRPLLQGLFGACFGVASVAGPLLGGAFTGSKATWRWCFYINLPLGGLTILVVIFLLKLDEQKPKLTHWRDTIRNLDPLGTLLFLPAITCLLLVLEWGAADYSWSSPRLIALMVVFAVLLVAFITWQYITRHTTATVPTRILFQRSVAFGGASQFCVGSAMLTVSIYIPLWFQAIKEVSAIQSGINTIPLVLSVVVGSILSGGLTQSIGYYTPFMIMGSSLMAVGTGLITTWNVHTSIGMWIGYQTILGLGVGCTMQHPNLAVQIVLPKQDVPTGTAILSLCQTLGGAVFTAVGQNLYIDKFTAGLERVGGLDTKQILGGGATDLTKSIPTALQPGVLEAYNASLTKGTFFAALIVACLAIPAALGMEWRSVKDKDSLIQAAAQDEEKWSRADEELAPKTMHNQSDMSPQASDTAHPELSAPGPVWKRVYRSSGQFTSYLTAKANPDLHDELKHGR